MVYSIVGHFGIVLLHDKATVICGAIATYNANGQSPSENVAQQLSNSRAKRCLENHWYFRIASILNQLMGWFYG